MTTTDTTIDVCDIALNLNLEEDPELFYFSWKVQVKDATSSVATLVEVELTGLLTLILILILNDPAKYYLNLNPHHGWRGRSYDYDSHLSSSSSRSCSCRAVDALNVERIGRML